jgi:hypothetical protein
LQYFGVKRIIRYVMNMLTHGVLPFD